MRWLLLFAIFGSVPVWGQETSVPPSSVPRTDPSESVLEPVRSAAIDRWEDEIQKLEALRCEGSGPERRHSVYRQQQHSAVGRDCDRHGALSSDPARLRGFQVLRRGGLCPATRASTCTTERWSMFVGNDVSGKPDDPTPGQVDPWVRYIVHVSQTHQPEAPVLLIEVTPTEKRFAVWPPIRALNAQLREIALTTPNTYFLATAEHFLDRHGNPRSELFVDDQLHLNEDGIRPVVPADSTTIGRAAEDVGGGRGRGAIDAEIDRRVNGATVSRPNAPFHVIYLATDPPFRGRRTAFSLVSLAKPIRRLRRRSFLDTDVIHSRETKRLVGKEATAEPHLHQDRAIEASS